LVSAVALAAPAAAAGGSQGARPPRPELSVDFADVRNVDRTPVEVRYSVGTLPMVRVVLECRDGPKGSYRVVASSVNRRGRLTDPRPQGLHRDYRVRVEGAQGIVLAWRASTPD
jgi:hypothetical protein